MGGAICLRDPLLRGLKFSPLTCLSVTLRDTDQGALRTGGRKGHHTILKTLHFWILSPTCINIVKEAC